MTKLIFAADHGGVAIKETLVKWATEQGHEPVNLGTFGEESVDYPDFIEPLARHLQMEEAAVGVLVCGSGIGMSIGANRFRHLRAALCHCVEFARLARAHNDANVLVLPGRFLTAAEAQACLEMFLKTSFEGGRHQKRVVKLSEL